VLLALHPSVQTFFVPRGRQVPFEQSPLRVQARPVSR
jgi:hypothetical protein